MKKSIIRFLLAIIAISMGVGLMYLLLLAANKTQGPLSNSMQKISNNVTHWEAEVILNNRENSRINKLSWLKDYKNNKNLLLNPRRILFGAHDNKIENSLESIIDLEDSLHTKLPIIHLYNAWGSSPENQFPAQMVNAITDLGSIPLITWEPWLNGFSGEGYNHLRNISLRNQHGLTDVSNGLYDAYISSWAKDAKKVNSFIFVRLGHEMNDPYRYPWGPQNNKPNEFVKAWKHIHDLFKRLGVNNVIWVWNPHPSYGYFDYFYPGKDYVDYIGVDALNFGTAVSWSKWWSFDQIFGTHYQELAKYNKPIMIAELGSLSYGGNRPKWFKDGLDNLPKKYPAVKSIVFFHVSNDETTTQQKLSWYFIYDKSSLQTVRKSIYDMEH